MLASSAAQSLLLGLAGLLSFILAYWVFAQQRPAVIEAAPGPVAAQRPFAASALVHPEQVTQFQYTPVHPPHDNINVPMMTRIFRRDSGASIKSEDTRDDLFAAVAESSSQGSSAPKGTLRRELSGLSSLFSLSAHDSIIPRAFSAPPTGQRAQSVQMTAPPSRARSREKTPGPSRVVSPVSPRPNVLTRSASKLQLGSNEAGPSRVHAELGSDAPSDAASSASPSKTPRKIRRSKKEKKLEISIRTCRKCQYNKDFINVLPNGEKPETAYFKSAGNIPLSEPPHNELVKRGLRPGDVYMHTTKTSRDLWIYLENDDKELEWVSIDLGYVRDLDRRHLSLSRGGNPSFVGHSWAHRTTKEALENGE
ncbi:hypothetical protein K466DRAFT_603707 [Polyporus arcularius HHB13444]|uniref:Uncharacterized protein n=1 Tax=Polyporus arcularius HHB13444 TaxID=1314778 RepID=A0A5C3P0S2_9APHY|nr:hypothetical protein K466DRAFT_603707 [Polyporus arcularius HHB13444]